MSFVINLDQGAEALEHPMIQVGGETYTGRHLGFLDALTFRKRIVEAKTFQEVADIYVEVLTAMQFPVEKVSAVPLKVLAPAVLRFFVSAMGEEPAP
ncbi:MAG TPA: hypothetical protein VJN95_08700 [Gemmatimonadales bacterium]|nr:hypothetical protein [Gemmatimonadales bacterium]